MKSNIILKEYSKNKILIEDTKNFIKIKGDNIEILLNKNKGCAIDKFYDYRVSEKFIFGFVPHGFFKDIGYGADFYSGHLVIEPLGKFKITDLNKPNIKIKNQKNIVFH